MDPVCLASESALLPTKVPQLTCTYETVTFENVFCIYAQKVTRYLYIHQMEESKIHTWKLFSKRIYIQHLRS